jgi:hypothetical protein
MTAAAPFQSGFDQPESLKSVISWKGFVLNRSKKVIFDVKW